MYDNVFGPAERGVFTEALLREVFYRRQAIDFMKTQVLALAALGPNPKLADLMDQLSSTMMPFGKSMKEQQNSEIAAIMRNFKDIFGKPLMVSYDGLTQDERQNALQVRQRKNPIKTAPKITRVDVLQKKKGR